MAEKEFETRIRQAKAALESYSAGQEEIARLYAQARENAASNYQAEQQALQRQNAADRNRAATEMLRTERNLDQKLASRGLSFSGENAQTALDLALSLRGQLADIDEQTKTQQAKLQSEAADRDLQLRLQEAQQRSTAAEKTASMQGDLASLLAQQAQQTGQNTGSGSNSGSGDATDGPNSGTASGDDANLPPIVKKAMEIVEKIRESILKKTEDSNDGITPTVKARDLAKQLVAAAGSGGKISGYAQQAATKLLLEQLLADNKLEKSYYDELMLNLQSLGYRPNYVQEMDEATGPLRKEAAEMFKEASEKYERVYSAAGYTRVESRELARSRARFEQLLFLYENSKSKEIFTEAVRGLGLSSCLDDFYARLAEENAGSDQKYTLGSATK